MAEHNINSEKVLESRNNIFETNYFPGVCKTHDDPR